jgi:RNA 3'-terminal phosphate cyclase (ATP)
MIDIDGSYGEGGGQILRTSVSLSAVTGQPVRIFNIRSRRRNPGLAPSHMTAIEAVARMSDADVDGLYPGSKELVFKPREVLGGRFELDVGTAGSISLVLQACLIPAILSRAPMNIAIKGGTDVNWSPPVDYVMLVHLPILSMFGPSCELEMRTRGFYPEGGGEVIAEISPTGNLSGVDLSSPGKAIAIEGVSYVQNLPKDIATRIRHSAIKKLHDYPTVKIESNSREGISAGAGIVLAAKCENTVLGASALGAKGIRSEVLGENCALELMETMESGASVDEHMLDQLLPYMALAKGESTVLAEELTQHAQTNIWVIERFLGKRFELGRVRNLIQVRTI